MSAPRTYDDEFRRRAVARMASRDRVSGLARELGICRKWLHEWKRQSAAPAATATDAAPPPPPDESLAPPSPAAVAELRQKEAQWEQITGRQALELDSFRNALPRVNALRRTRPSGAPASMTRSAPTGSGKATTDGASRACARCRA